MRLNLIRKHGTLPGGDPDGLTKWGWVRWCGNNGRTWPFSWASAGERRKSSDSVGRDWLGGRNGSQKWAWAAEWWGPCLKRGMSKLLRHGLGHANSHFETASSPTSEYLEFPRRAHSSILALSSNHYSAMTFVGAQPRFSGSSSCAACCTAAECQPDALSWCNTGPFSSCGLSGHDEATATDMGDISCCGPLTWALSLPYGGKMCITIYHQDTSVSLPKETYYNILVEGRAIWPHS